MTPSRKRGRSKDEETEFTPLSKRINNLHINTNLLLEQQQQKSNQMLMADGWGLQQANLPDSPPLSVQSVEWNQQNPAPYNPELTETQNPFYYTSNKLLYEMYMERQERNNQ